jgi:hypothetical protein
MLADGGGADGGCQYDVHGKGTVFALIFMLGFEHHMIVYC